MRASRLLLAVVTLVGFAAAEAHAIQRAYTGSWNNQTFGSTGAANATVDIVAPSILFVLDLDGNVFGGSNPLPLSLAGVFALDGSATFTPLIGHPTYGDVTGSLSSTGAVTANCTNVPGGSIANVSITGQYGETAINLNYVVNFTARGGPTSAVGTIDLRLVPEPASVLLVCAPLALLRRKR